MVWLPDGEKLLKICLFVLKQSTNVTDTHTDTAWRHRPRLCIASRGKNSTHARNATDNLTQPGHRQESEATAISMKRRQTRRCTYTTLIKAQKNVNIRVVVSKCCVEIGLYRCDPETEGAFHWASRPPTGDQPVTDRRPESARPPDAGASTDF